MKEVLSITIVDMDVIKLIRNRVDDSYCVHWRTKDHEEDETFEALDEARQEYLDVIRDFLT